MIHVGQSLIQQSVQNLCNIAKMGVERPAADFRFPADVRYGDCVVVLISLDPQESLLDRLLCIQRPPVLFRSPDMSNLLMVGVKDVLQRDLLH